MSIWTKNMMEFDQHHPVCAYFWWLRNFFFDSRIHPSSAEEGTILSPANSFTPAATASVYAASTTERNVWCCFKTSVPILLLRYIFDSPFDNGSDSNLMTSKRR